MSHATADTRQVSKQLGTKRMNDALDKIQRAQNIIDAALSDLSAINGASALWRSGIKLHSNVKAYWGAVNDKRQSLERSGGPFVDSLTAEYEMQRAGKSP